MTHSLALSLWCRNDLTSGPKNFYLVLTCLVQQRFHYEVVFTLVHTLSYIFSADRQPWRDSAEFQCAALTSLCLIRRLPHDRWPELC